MGWWTWGDENAIVKASFDGGWIAPGRDQLVSVPHVVEALEIRWYGVPSERVEARETVAHTHRGRAKSTRDIRIGVCHA